MLYWFLVWTELLFLLDDMFTQLVNARDVDAPFRRATKMSESPPFAAWYTGRDRSTANFCIAASPGVLMTSSLPAEFYSRLTNRALANLTAVTGYIIRNPKLKIVNGQMLDSIGADIHPYPEDSADPMMDVSQVLLPLPSLHPPTFLASPPFPLSPHSPSCAALYGTPLPLERRREREGEGGGRERERVRFGIFLDAHAFSRISCA